LGVGSLEHLIPGLSDAAHFLCLYCIIRLRLSNYIDLDSYFVWSFATFATFA
jgi:hypothetical protein